jgi:hypothetical protein
MRAKENSEMAAKPFVVTPQDYPPPLNIVGEHVTVIASGEATESYEIFHQRGPEGSGPPPHSHPWDESFFVTKGQIDFGIGAESTTAFPGTRTCRPVPCIGSASAPAAGNDIDDVALGASKRSSTWPGKSRRWIPI